LPPLRGVAAYAVAREEDGREFKGLRARQSSCRPEPEPAALARNHPPTRNRPGRYSESVVPAEVSFSLACHSRKRVTRGREVGSAAVRRGPVGRAR
jgi:hypothetical protein